MFSATIYDLEAAVVRNGFGVLYIHDLGATRRSKSLDFTEECRIFEVCNPKQVAKVMASDMRLNMTLPCRISVYTEKSKHIYRSYKTAANACKLVTKS